MNIINQRLMVKKAEIAGILDRICQELELPDSKFQLAKERYEAVGAWLVSGGNPLLRGIEIYPQGSASIGTTVNPQAKVEHDIDLVSHNAQLPPDVPPPIVKKAIGDRLKQNGRYQPILQEKLRCWRLPYANEFHLDITPSILNPNCRFGGELVPEKGSPLWKPTNPRGFRTQFEERAALQPRLMLSKMEFAEARAQIEALPEPAYFKGILRRSVQLSKRHRDLWFATRDSTLAPISIVITILAARSYEFCVRQFTYDTEFDVLLDVLRNMPRFIETREVDGETNYYVWNETTLGENFAEKWNNDSRLANAFFAWQKAALADFEKLTELAGRDEVYKHLEPSLGDRPVGAALAAATRSISNSRRAGDLSIASGVGLVIGRSSGIRVRDNTFFGR